MPTSFSTALSSPGTGDFKSSQTASSGSAARSRVSSFFSEPAEGANTDSMKKWPPACGVVSPRHNANSFESGKAGPGRQPKEMPIPRSEPPQRGSIAQECGSNASGPMLRSNTHADSLELGENLMFIN